MRVLVDTNLIIGREDNATLNEQTLELFRLLNENHVQTLVHPVTTEEIRRDHDEARRKLVLAKLGTYPVLQHPPLPDADFRARSGEGTSSNDARDTHFLRALYANAVDFLITNDKDLIDRSARIRLQDRTLSVDGALDYFGQLFGRVIPTAPTYLRRSPLHELDLSDPFFDSFRADYSEFDVWFRGVAAQGRSCVWVPDPGGRIGALLIYKEEADAVGDLPARHRLKLCSLKVADSMSRQRLSELLLAFAFRYSSRNGIEECYLTILPSHAPLVNVLASFGFRDVGPYRGRERLLVKRLVPDESVALRLPGEFFREYYPGYLDGPNVSKFLVPVQPDWHERLFPEYRANTAQRILEDYGGGEELYRLTPAGNAIRKAYLCNAQTRQLKTGDLLLFYRSQDVQRVTHVGIVEDTRVCNRVQQITEFVGNRTVLPVSELEALCHREALAILFWDAGRFGSGSGPGTPLGGAVSSAPQSIMRVEHGVYRRLCDRRAP